MMTPRRMLQESDELLFWVEECLVQEIRLVPGFRDVTRQPRPVDGIDDGIQAGRGDDHDVEVDRCCAGVHDFTPLASLRVAR